GGGRGGGRGRGGARRGGTRYRRSYGWRRGGRRRGGRTRGRGRNRRGRGARSRGRPRGYGRPARARAGRRTGDAACVRGTFGSAATREDERGDAPAALTRPGGTGHEGDDTTGLAPNAPPPRDLAHSAALQWRFDHSCPGAEHDCPSSR